MSIVIVCVRELARHIRMQAAVVEDPGSFPSTHMAALSHLEQIESQRVQQALLAS